MMQRMNSIVTHNQAILTKYLPPTFTRPSRMKATCGRGSLTLSCEAIPGPDKHVTIANALIAKFVKEDEGRYAKGKNPWAAPRICGCLPNGNYAHVFVK